jgi:TonB family protein
MPLRRAILLAAIIEFGPFAALLLNHGGPQPKRQETSPMQVMIGPLEESPDPQEARPTEARRQEQKSAQPAFEPKSEPLAAEPTSETAMLHQEKPRPEADSESQPVATPQPPQAEPQPETHADARPHPFTGENPEAPSEARPQATPQSSAPPEVQPELATNPKDEPPSPAPPGAREGLLGAKDPILKVKPVYPRDALDQGVEGRVKVRLSVSRSGEVTDAEVLEAAPQGVFDHAVLRAVMKYKFEPNGESYLVDQTVVFRIARK